ncbi:hypothetical protein SAMN05216464_11860 [Mucilaginibacter pineti]|uniref:Uncharacterized protein n=1 Tax=Mucilaginibacter pineti TaxID=1391627 RepID=A0A1G7L863_9SPHI|nr:hypothetical protein [Mucilaginibacter pineti]SDF45220.1 hypothetical protein SAMN05216464_11860 [Mucilaginibacter pineti]
MLSHLSWAGYIEAVIVALIIYYAFVAARFYGSDIKELFARKGDQNPTIHTLPEQLVYQAESQAVLKPEIPDNFIVDEYIDSDLEDADELIGKLKRSIHGASEKAYAPGNLVNQLKNIFKAYASLKKSPHRPAINELVVSECERTGTAELSEDEVDEWWSD